MERRQVSSRSNGLIQGLASWLARTDISANQISAFSIVASLAVPAGLFFLDGWAAVIVALVGIQLRLLANVIDGLVAVEGGKASPVGALYNEFPDRIADTIIFVSMGYAVQCEWLGWLCALLAAFTAYIRVFGGALGQPQVFAGPMAKQHRMAIASIGLIAGAVFAPWVPAQLAWQVTLVIIALGSVMTCVTRTVGIVKRLEGA
jgi:phosphatidylglycerophosphate synthase